MAITLRQKGSWRNRSSSPVILYIRSTFFVVRGLRVRRRFPTVAKAGHKRIGLIGASELAEIAVIVATEIDVEIVTIIDSNVKKSRALRHTRDQENDLSQPT